jgi:hypothetical protein
LPSNKISYAQKEFSSSLLKKGAERSAIKCFVFCSAELRGLCGDPRIFDDLTKVQRVFRNPGGGACAKPKDISVATSCCARQQAVGDARQP